MSYVTPARLKEFKTLQDYYNSQTYQAKLTNEQLNALSKPKITVNNQEADTNGNITIETDDGDVSTDSVNALFDNDSEAGEDELGYYTKAEIDNMIGYISEELIGLGG